MANEQNSIQGGRRPGRQCPKCGEQLTDNVCRACGWAVIEYPAVVPDSVAAFEAARSEAFDRIAKANAENSGRIEKLKAENGTLKAENGTLKAENERLKAENGTLKAESRQLAADLNRQRKATEEMRAARDEANEKAVRSGGMLPKAFLVWRNPIDPTDDMAVNVVGDGSNRYVNRAAIVGGAPAAEGEKDQVIRVSTQVRIDFRIDETEGRFFITDSAATLLLDGKAVDRKMPLTNGARLSVKGARTVEAVVSTPRRR